MKFQDKFASLRQLNSPNSQDKFQLCFIGMYLIRFLANFAILRRLIWISWLCDHAKYRKPWYYDLRHLHYTNWLLKICIWQLYFSSWSPRGNLRIFSFSALNKCDFHTHIYLNFQKMQQLPNSSEDVPMTSKLCRRFPVMFRWFPKVTESAMQVAKSLCHLAEIKLCG